MFNKGAKLTLSLEFEIMDKAQILLNDNYVE